MPTAPKPSPLPKTILCLMLLTLSAVASGRQPQKFLVFDYHIQPAWIKAHAGEYVFVWGASQETVSVFQEFSPGTQLSTYFPYMRDPNPATTLTEWQAKHPTWVVYHCDGKTPVLPYNDKNITLDTNNPSVVQWQIENFLSGTTLTKTAALDNVQFRNDIGVCGIRSADRGFVRRYSGEVVDRQFADDVANWVEKVAASLRQHGIRVVVNHIPDASFVGGYPAANVDFPPTQQLVAAVDGIVEEHSNLILRNPVVARSVFRLADYVASKHKWMYFIYQMNPLDERTAESAMASYLIMTSPFSAVFLSSRDATYGSAPDFFGYDRDIGTACGASEHNGLFTRTFTGGMAIFALPDGTQRTVTVPAGYEAVDGKPAPSTLTLKPGAGLVLYRQGKAHCAG